MSIVKKIKLKKPITFDFVLEALAETNPYTKPMFGATSVYIDNKIIFILRDKPDSSAEDNGVWLATTDEHHESLKKDFPNMRSIALFGPGTTGWQVLPAEADNFEETVMKACECVLNGDIRIGKIPKSKLSRNRKKMTAKPKTSRRKVSK